MEILTKREQMAWEIYKDLTTISKNWTEAEVANLKEEAKVKGNVNISEYFAMRSFEIADNFLDYIKGGKPNGRKS